MAPQCCERAKILCRYPFISPSKSDIADKLVDLPSQMGWFVSSLSKAVSAVAEKQALKDAVQHPPAKRHEAKRLIDEIHQLISFRFARIDEPD